MNYAKALTVTRASRALQQKDIAEILDKSPSYISRIEKGERPMTATMVALLCERLNIPQELFYLLGNDKPHLDAQDRKTVDQLSNALLRIIVSD